jgi:hypothetical protein
MALITGKCSVCNGPLPGSFSIVQYSDHYHCECEYGFYICPTCYKQGHKKCPKCGNSKLKFHSGAATAKSASDNRVFL